MWERQKLFKSCTPKTRQVLTGHLDGGCVLVHSVADPGDDGGVGDSGRDAALMNTCETFVQGGPVYLPTRSLTFSGPICLRTQPSPQSVPKKRKKDSGYTPASPQQVKSVLVKLFLTSIQDNFTNERTGPSQRTTACTWTLRWSPGERVNWSVWLSASQQIHKQLKMNCTSLAEAGRIILDLVPKIVRRDIYRVTLV